MPFGGQTAITGHHSTALDSTTTPLTAGAVFTGDKVNVLNAAVISVAIYSDVASATDGLDIQQSTDGTNWDHCDNFTLPADSGKTFSIQPVAAWLRIIYTNGAINQTAFRMMVKLNATYIKPSSHRIQDSIIGDDDAELVKAVISAKADGNGFQNLTSTSSNNLRVTDAESGLAIAKGDVAGTSFIHKFGAAPDFDVSDGFVTVWDGAEDNEPYTLMQYVYSTTADIDSVIAQDAGDTQDVEIQGLDANYDLVTQTVTLNGQTRVALSTNLIRVFRARNANSTDFAQHIFVYVNGATTGGVPDVNADIRAVVHSDNNQTEMAVYTIPNGKTGYMRSWYASTAGAKRDSSHTIKVIARNFGKVFNLKHKANIDVNGTSYIQHRYEEPEVFAAKTDIEVRMDTDTDIAGVAAGFDIVLVND